MDISERIRVRLADLHMTPNAASVRAGLPRDAIRDILTGKSRNPRADTLLKIAEALQVDPAYLLDPNQPAGGILPLPAEEMVLPIRYEVAAGTWLAHDELREEPYGYAAASRIKKYEHCPQWLERVRGDSVDRIIPDGALVHVVDAIALGYEPKHGDVVVVVRTRAQGAFMERSVKQIELTANEILLWPRSFNPKWNKPLKVDDGLGENEDADVNIVGVVVQAYIRF